MDSFVIYLALFYSGLPLAFAYRAFCYRKNATIQVRASIANGTKFLWAFRLFNSLETNANFPLQHLFICVCGLLLAFFCFGEWIEIRNLSRKLLVSWESREKFPVTSYMYAGFIDLFIIILLSIQVNWLIITIFLPGKLDKC